MSVFSERLKELRLSKRLTLEQLGIKLGLSKSSINMYERGEREPSFENLEAIADYFNVDLDYLLGKSDIKSKVPYTAKINAIDRTTRIPVLGAVPAGIPIEAIQDILDYEEISPEMALSGDFFALRIRGDSMEPKISDGDIVIIRRQETAENGETAVVMVNGNDATVKRFYKNESGVTLISTNPNYPPFQYTPEQVETLPVRVIGKVVELRARF